uniref:WW domain-containing protein n=1 Tax=Hyaloperonospora arabidopsidis (strain Emoy2) TaxID=559515 RepID=M4C6D3_HYAAE
MPNALRSGLSWLLPRTRHWKKREAEKALAKLVEVLGSRAFLAGTLTDDAVQFVTNQLRLELETSHELTEKVKQERAVCKKEDLHASRSERADGKELLWRQQLQERVQQLQASQADVAKLEDQLMQQKRMAADEKTQLQQALEVKLREVDALCSDVVLPVDYERIKTVEGVLCYRRKGSDGSNVLEDPRVPIAIKLRSGPTLARAVDEEPSLTPDNIVSAVDVHSHLARDHAADGDETRRSFSTPHVMQSSDVPENIHIPLDGSRKHSIEDFTPLLPSGWEMRVTLSGAIFFYNKFTSTTTWTDPRLLGAAHAPSLPSDHASQEQPLVCNSSVITFESQPSRPDSITIRAESISDEFHYIDVVFEDRGPIGVRFQANVPDLGATVTSLAPDMAASVKGVIAPDDELIAVNKNAVDSAPFRHVMLLLQGGLRPLTLTFKRARKEAQRSIDPGAAFPSSDGGVSIVESGDASDTLFDDEDVIDEGTVVDLEQLRVPTASPHPTAGHRDDSEASMNVADVIITNIFSLFWKPRSSSVD